MKLAAMLRVRNESRWIGRVLRSLTPLCANTYVLDDGSTDNTVSICQSIPNVTVYETPFKDSDTWDHGHPLIDETRDKDWLLAKIMSDSKPDWVLQIDGDEELEPAGVAQILESINGGLYSAFSLNVVYLWNNEHTMRVDGLYQHITRQSLFSTKGSDLKFKPTIHGKGTTTNLHCTNVPADRSHSFAECPARLIHYGYIDRAMRLKKYNFYLTVDPDNELEDRYRHIVAGDLPEMPAGAITKWGGPLTLVPF